MGHGRHGHGNGVTMGNFHDINHDNLFASLMRWMRGIRSLSLFVLLLVPYLCV
jgi:hypothetical protein